MSSGSFDPKIKRLEVELQNYEDQHEQEMKLLGESSGARECQREQTLERLEGKIAETKSKLEAAKSERNSRQTISLINCLEDFWESHNSVFEQAYLRLLSSSHYLRNQAIPKTVADMVNTITTKVLPETDNSYTPLICFVGQMMLANNLSIPGLQDWLKAELERRYDPSSEDVNTEKCLRFITDIYSSTEDTFSCLLVQVTSSEQSSAQASQRRYSMQGWYISDVLAYKQTFDTAVNIHLPDDSPDTQQVFSKTELEENLRSLIDVSLRHSDGPPESLQVFLPPELMNQPIDSWSNLPLSEESALTLGFEHREGVFIRCDKRLTERRLRWADWAKRWRILDQAPSEPTCELFLSTDEAGCLTIERQLVDIKKRVFGLKLICLPHRLESDAVKRNSFFSLLSRSAVPAALWLRQQSEEKGCEDLIDEVVGTEQLRAVPNTVYKRRLDADFVGQHLSLMWEDPHLLPPEFRQKPIV